MVDIKNEDKPTFQDYCARKNVVDNNLIDKVITNIVILNPGNLNVTNVNCNEVVKKLTEEL